MGPATTQTKEPICRSDYEKLPAPGKPDWGLDYDVFPDKQQRKPERLCTEREAVRKALASAPATPLPALLKVEIAHPSSWRASRAKTVRRWLSTAWFWHLSQWCASWP
jgi:hypothetical protein